MVSSPINSSINKLTIAFITPLPKVYRSDFAEACFWPFAENHHSTGCIGLWHPEWNMIKLKFRIVPIKSWCSAITYHSIRADYNILKLVWHLSDHMYKWLATQGKWTDIEISLLVREFSDQLDGQSLSRLIGHLKFCVDLADGRLL